MPKNIEIFELKASEIQIRRQQQKNSVFCRQRGQVVHFQNKDEKV